VAAPVQASRFQGKCAVITGGDRGIGAAVARRLGAEGAAVVIGYRRDAVAAEKVVVELKALGVRAAAVQADVIDVDQIARLVERAVSELGRLDVLVCCAGIEHFGSLEQLTPDDFDRVFAVNTRAQLFAVQRAVPHMRSGGRIVLTSSVSAQLAVFGHPVYAASKAAVESMALNLSAELGQRGITINAIAPGATATEMAAEYTSRYRHPKLKIPIEKWLPLQGALGRIAEPSEIAAAYAFLASDDASYMTGRTLAVDGGYF
jgi:NAD(P)-dependent dehydrogenase (short-subunit alcohol dehydrogenase family)